MRYRHAGTLIAVALVAAVAGGMFTASGGRLAGQTNQPERPDRIEGRPNFQRHLAGQQRGQLGPGIPRRPAGDDHPAGRLSL